MIPLKTYLFSKHRQSCFPSHFVETGTNNGGGVRLALECGYDRVFTIEKDPELYLSTSKEFGQNQHAVCFLGDSATELEIVLRLVTQPCTFWLDAHDVERGTCNVLNELSALAHSAFKENTILIDDWEDFGTPKHGNISKAEVIEALRRINPEYRIACHYAEVGAPNILEATV